MRKKVLPLLICVLLSQGVVHGANAVSITRRAHDADKQVSYRGTKAICVTVNGKMACSVVKVVHMKPEMTRKEYFSPPAVAGMIVIEKNSKTWKYTPRSHRWETVPSMCPNATQTCSDRLFDNYNVQLVGSDKVAGRDAYVIKAVPKNAGDSQHKVWVDKKCYLTLGTQVQTATGTVLTSSKFTSITVDPRDISSDAFVVKKIEPTSMPAHVDFAIRKPSYLPKGYRIVGKAEVTVTHRCCAHLQISNGVNTISLFERRCNKECSALCTPHNLPTMMAWTKRGVHFTLVGDISRVEMQKIASSIK